MLVRRLARWSRWNLRLPFSAQVPAVVVGVGAAIVLAITLIGANQLEHHSERAAALRGRALSASLAERLVATPEVYRPAAVTATAKRAGAEILLVRNDGNIVVDATLDPPSSAGVQQMLISRRGETTTRSGRNHFHTERLPPPLDRQSLIIFTPAPQLPFGLASMVQFVAVFAAILIGVAALAALGLARSVHADVTYLTERIVKMAGPAADPAGAYVPVRTVDQVGSMTNAFNELVDRFLAAEHTYRRDLQRALEYERDRSAFLAALSHELRTPLNVILGFTDVLLSEVDGPLTDDAKENLEVVRQSGAHLRQLINDVLDLSALESGELHLEAKATDVHSVAADVVREARITAREKGLTIRLEGSRAMAWADPLRLRQIIGNLVGNAVKFTQRGFVHVKVEERREHVAIIVQDSGPGIAPEEQAAIFEEYRQVGDVKARKAGSGLGLAITRRLVHMHNGTIALFSEIGKGSRFTVLIGRKPSRLRSVTADGLPQLSAPEVLR